jgi:hypothetical protein
MDLVLSMDLKPRTTALKNYLSDIHENEEARTGLLLPRLGFGAAEIEILSPKHMEKLAEGLCEILRKRVFNKRERLFRSISGRYRPEKGNPKSLGSTGTRSCLAGERVRQLGRKALELCREPDRIEEMESAFGALARDILSKEGRPCSKAPSDPTVKSAEKNGVRNAEEKACDLAVGKTAAGEYAIVLHPRGKSENGEIVFGKNEAGTFHHEMAEAMKKLGWRSSRVSREISEIRNKYPRAYEKREKEEDEKLERGFNEGLKIEELSGIPGRQPSAVRSRLEKLGLLKAPSVSRARRIDKAYVARANCRGNENETEYQKR